MIFFLFSIEKDPELCYAEGFVSITAFEELSKFRDL